MDTRYSPVREFFDLTGRVAIVTRGAGLLGYQHSTIPATAGAHVVAVDLFAANLDFAQTNSNSRTARVSRPGNEPHQRNLAARSS